MLGSTTSAPPGAAMHLSDTLVFGPLHPLLPQPVRVRLGALLVGLVGGLGILTLAGVVLVLGPAALPAPARSLLPGWGSPGVRASTGGNPRIHPPPEWPRGPAGLLAVAFQKEFALNASRFWIAIPPPIAWMC